LVWFYKDEADMAEAGSIREIVMKLHDRCTTSLTASLAEDFDSLNGASYAFSSDLDLWNSVLCDRPEQVLFTSAANEFVLALLNNAQGQYRNAFKSLRLSLELILQGTYLSVNLIALNEWLRNQADTSWSAIMDDQKGVFAKRFCRAFFPELADETVAFKGLSETLYREMSECIHGNVPNKIPLPNTIDFNKSVFELWHEKTGTLRYIVNFALTVRYYSSLTKEAKQKVSSMISDQLGNFASIRDKLAVDL
jgi:hypothetical protein